MSNEQEILGNTQTPAIAPTQDEKTLALLAHILTLFTSFIGPLIIYLVKKDESSFVTDHAKESLNFQITLFILYIISFILIIILVGILALAVLGTVHLILLIVASIKAMDGKIYRYPINIRLIK